MDTAMPKPKKPVDEATMAYLAPAPTELPQLPPHLCVRILVDRPDGQPLTAADVEAARAAFPLSSDRPKKRAPKRR